jgi:hypothetical protein
VTVAGKWRISRMPATGEHGHGDGCPFGIDFPDVDTFGGVERFRQVRAVADVDNLQQCIVADADVRQVVVLIAFDGRADEEFGQFFFADEISTVPAYFAAREPIDLMDETP